MRKMSSVIFSVNLSDYEFYVVVIIKKFSSSCKLSNPGRPASNQIFNEHSNIICHSTAFAKKMCRNAVRNIVVSVCPSFLDVTILLSIFGFPRNFLLRTFC